MSGERRTIEIHIVMTESGALVVDADADEAAERAEEEFPDDDVRQVALTIELKAPRPHLSRLPLP
jgi:hypothetical protein